jgi:hypothetical protein
MEIEDTPGAEMLQFRRSESYSYKVLEAENARGLRKEVSTEDFVYPDGTKRAAGFFADSNPSWIGFKVEKENRYFIFSILKKMPIPADWLEILFRVDGGKVLRTSAGGVNFVPTIAIESLGEIFKFDKGAHTLGIQAKGKSMTQKVEIDCFIVQPALQTAVFRKDRGTLMIALNLSKEPLPWSVALPTGASLRSFNDTGEEMTGDNLFLENGQETRTDKWANNGTPGKKIRVEPGGFALARW